MGTKRNNKSLKQWCTDNNRKDILEEFDVKKNQMSVDEISYGSNKKVWWKCSNGHHWDNQVYKRTKLNSGCPICNGRRLSAGINDLKTTHPQLVNEWDYENNKEFNPSDITRISTKKSCMDLREVW